MNIADVKVGDSTKMTGIKLQPKIDGHHIHKDFDVKLALKNAIKNDDLVIFAGNADNDKEALNIFNYASKQAQWKIPYEAHEINPDYVKAVKSEIDSLPIKILFVEPPINEMDPKILSLADFMKKTSELFPEKVEIIKQTEIGKNNNFLDSIKNAIKSYSNQNLAFAKNFNTKLYLKILAKKLAPIFAGITMASGIVLACSDTLKTKQKKHNS